jgi:hypothetical protein
MSKILGMTKPDAAEWWLGVFSATMPYTHQRLSTMIVRPEGSPDGEPVAWTFSDDEVIEVITTSRSEQEGEGGILRVSRCFSRFTCICTVTRCDCQKNRNTQRGRKVDHQGGPGGRGWPARGPRRPGLLAGGETRHLGLRS